MKYDLNLLKAFDALYKERNVTRAAERINISQPAMSAVLGRLRELFNDPLFIRDKFGVAPTEKSIEIHPTIERALDELDSLVQSEQVLDLSSEKRTFNIAATDYFQLLILPLLMQRIRQQAPNIRIITSVFRQDITETGMMTGQTELAFGRLTDPPDSLIVRHAIDEGFACLVSKDHPVIKNHLTLKQLEKFQHVVVQPRGKLKTGIFRILEERNIKRNIACTVTHFHGISDLITGTDYIVLLPQRIAEKFAKNKGLRLVSVPDTFETFPFHLSWHRRNQKDPAHQWLRNQILECCQLIL
ncbi:MAG: LysR family transcriptional regulator [Cellvibrionaceae bacterium]